MSYLGPPYKRKPLAYNNRSTKGRAKDTTITMTSPFPFHIKQHTIPTQHIREWPRATASSQEATLYLSIKQYTPHDNPTPQPGDITILAAHANGFPKELYEPLWADLHAALSNSSNNVRIRGIWIADVSNQGYSGTLNEHAQGDEPSWDDHARDLLHLTNVFRASMPRPIIGVGHSFGAAILTRLSLIHPRLLTTLVLLDPTVTAFTLAPSGPGKSPARASAFRRETWPDREAAAASFRRSPFYRAWDPRVLEAWIAHGVRSTPTAILPSPSSGSSAATANDKATLRTPKHQEVFTYFRPLWPHVITNPDGTLTINKATAPDFDPSVASNALSQNTIVFPFYRSEGGSILAQLPAVRPSVLWIFGGDSDLGTPEGRKLKTETCGVGAGGSGGLKAGRVAEVVMEGRGHLFPMEVPTVCARHAAGWIVKEMERWRKEEREYEEWTKLPLKEKTTLSAEFLDKVGRPSSKKNTSLVGSESKL